MIGLPSSSYCTASYSTCATPCAMPPCCWPATSIGLTMLAAVVDRDVAQQLDAARCRGRPRPPRCARRTGTTTNPASKSSSCCSRASMPSGRRASILHRVREVGPRQRARGHARDLEPAVADHDVVGVGLEQVRGELLGLRRAPLRSRPTSALPPICSEREPPVPPPAGLSSVSECTTRTSSIGTPSASLTIIENAVS